MKNGEWLRSTKKDYDKKYVILIYHMLVEYRRTINPKSRKAKDLKYRCKACPFERVLTSRVIDTLDCIDVSKLNNKAWYYAFIHRCKMNYVFL